MNVTGEGLTAARVASLCGVRPGTVRRWAHRGRLPADRPDGLLSFGAETVLALYLDRSFRACLKGPRRRPVRPRA